MNEFKQQNTQTKQKALKIAATKIKEFQNIKDMDLNQIKEMSKSKLLSNQQLLNQQHPSDAQDKKLQALQQLRSKAAIRYTDHIPPIKLHSFTPITAQEGRMLLSKLKELKLVQHQKLKNIDINDLSTDYYKNYHEFKNQLKGSENLLTEMGSNISAAKQYIQLLRSGSQLSKLQIWSRDEPEQIEKQYIQKHYESMRKKYMDKEISDDIDVESIINEGKRYLENRYGKEQEIKSKVSIK